MDLLKVVISLAAAVGTGLQLRLSLMDFGANRREAVDWWNAEDALVAETPRRNRRRTRRELRSWRDPETHRTIRDLEIAIASWVFLVVAAVLATYVAVVESLD